MPASSATTISAAWLNQPGRLAQWSWLCLALILPSGLIVWKETGAGVLVYAAVVALLVPVLWRRAARAEQWPDRAVLAAAVCTGLALVAAMVVFYPRFNSAIPGVGADDDDALNIGVIALVSGRSPYGDLTYLGATLHQFPGAFVLAAPFTLLFGSSAWQNIFWLGLFWVAVAKALRDATVAIRYCWVVLVASPVVLQGLLTGVGHMTNAISVLLGMHWLMAATEPGEAVALSRPRRRVWLAALFWGVALAARPNFFVLLPLLGGWLWRQRGPRVAVTVSGLSVAVILLLSVPFIVTGGLAAFTPLDAGHALSRFNDGRPLGTAIGALLVLVTLACSCLRLSQPGLFLAGALLMAVPVVPGTLIELHSSVESALYYGTWAVFPMWFVLMAAARGRWFAGYSSES